MIRECRWKLLENNTKYIFGFKSPPKTNTLICHLSATNGKTSPNKRHNESLTQQQFTITCTFFSLLQKMICTFGISLCVTHLFSGVLLHSGGLLNFGMPLWSCTGASLGRWITAERERGRGRERERERKRKRDREICNHNTSEAGQERRERGGWLAVIGQKQR